MTTKQTAFLKVLKTYSGIAATGNIQWELGWRGRMVGAVGASLKRKGLVTIGGGGDTMDNQYKGSIYKLKEAKNAH